MVLAIFVVACAGRPSPSPGYLASGTAPWEIPDGALGAQHLFRLAYEGPGTAAGLKVALRLEEPTTFEVRVFDRLGRAVWAAASRGGRTLLVDHEAERFCRVSGAVTWAGLEDLGPVAPGLLPALLLGRVPARPPDPSAPAGAGEFDFRDEQGGRWTGRVDERGPAAWTLWEGGEPRWWWTRTEGGGGILSQRGAGRQIRWEPVAREPMGDLGELAPPPEYGESCDELARSRP